VQLWYGEPSTGVNGTGNFLCAARSQLTPFYNVNKDLNLPWIHCAIGFEKELSWTVGQVQKSFPIVLLTMHPTSLSKRGGTSQSHHTDSSCLPYWTEFVRKSSRASGRQGTKHRPQSLFLFAWALPVLRRLVFHSLLMFFGLSILQIRNQLT